jgi:hypothetical protein
MRLSPDHDLVAIRDDNVLIVDVSLDLLAGTRAGAGADSAADDRAGRSGNGAADERTRDRARGPAGARTGVVTLVLGLFARDRATNGTDHATDRGARRSGHGAPDGGTREGARAGAGSLSRMLVTFVDHDLSIAIVSRLIVHGVSPRVGRMTRNRVGHDGAACRVTGDIAAEPDGIANPEQRTPRSTPLDRPRRIRRVARPGPRTGGKVPGGTMPAYRPIATERGGQLWMPSRCFATTIGW